MKAGQAHHLVGRAIAEGELTRQPCEECGAEKAEGHHDDYDKPLEVRWLCRSHHVRWHKKNGAGANKAPEDSSNHYLTFRCPEDLRVRLQAIADLEERSLSDVIRRAMRWHIAECAKFDRSTL